ncbi:hypothetical protein SDC9_188346 [bioreactor metagenome]|uniref:Uncharacterized protein n=1 Tax=bioreactor metagenome TaxID=1076179 RepID=A0A645HPC1_9ZZZZ
MIGKDSAQFGVEHARQFAPELPCFDGIALPNRAGEVDLPALDTAGNVGVPVLAHGVDRVEGGTHVGQPSHLLRAEDGRV